MILKVIFTGVVGSVLGYILGLFLRKLGRTCPLTCTSWSSIITGAILGILFVLDK